MILTFLAASRPGEIKFNDMANWQFHHFFNVLDIKWSELKTMTTYAMPMHASNWHFLLDFWHALGCFWTVESGLFRTDEHEPFKTFLFPSFHRKADKTVSKNQAQAIQDNLPLEMTKKQKAQFTGKSWRKGSTSILIAHPDTTHEDTCSITGHSFGTNTDSYADRHNIAFGLRGS